MAKKNYYPGDTVSRYYYFRDKTNTPIDPDTFSSEVYDPADVKVASPTLINVAIGQYEFNYTLADDADAGIWHVVIKGAKGTYNRVRSFGFQVVALP
jgi:uncharacterized protein YfaS (alpha-2-macroglobulin family)